VQLHASIVGSSDAGGHGDSGHRDRGNDLGMSTDDRVDHRAAELLPEELAAGSEDPKAQAEAILQESDEREICLEPTSGQRAEHRTSTDSAE
jgi:hypothetical protein